MGFPLSFSHKVSSTTKRSITSILVAASFLSWGATTVKATGSDEIQFRKQTIDLGRSETVTVADINHDGRLDIVSGENWYEQAPRAPGSEGPRWIKHHFRDLAFTDGYIVNGRHNLSPDLNGPTCGGMAYETVKKVVKAGDIIIVPAGVVHGWLDIPEHVDYLSFRPSPGILTAGWVHPVLKK